MKINPVVIFTKEKEVLLKIIEMNKSLEQRFLNNCRAILETMKEACQMVPNPPIDVAIFNMIDLSLNYMDPSAMLKYYANETHIYWDKVADHDENFICTNVEMVINSVKMDQNMRKTILQFINSKKMTQVVELMKQQDKQLKKQGCDENDLALNYIWSAMEALVKISIKYTLQERAKDAKSVPGARYDLASMAAQWSVRI